MRMITDPIADTSNVDDLLTVKPFESPNVNPGFVPESLAFWRRWIKHAAAGADSYVCTRCLREVETL